MLREYRRICLPEVLAKPERGSEDVAPLWFCKCLYKRRRINENMVWTDSQDYDADEILYTARTVLFDKTNRLMREIIILIGVSPQLLQVRHAAAHLGMSQNVGNRRMPARPLPV